MNLLTPLIFSLMLVQVFTFPATCTYASTPAAGEKDNYHQAFRYITDMLEGKKPLNYEEALFQIENAWNNNQLSIENYQQLLCFHTDNIRHLIAANQHQIPKELPFPQKEKEENYRKALANWAIYTYLTDTTLFLYDQYLYYHAPYRYSHKDPMGTIDWQNTQVTHLLQSQQGNCYALASLFKILSDRLHTDARLNTAPGHIYITHADPYGVEYNIELSNRAFPGTGTIETLTYTSSEAVKNNISLRTLDDKQSVALTLVYLAKSYQHRFKDKTAPFLLDCAETALQHDSDNLNAMLLKAQVLEERLLSQNQAYAQLKHTPEYTAYQQWLSHLHRLGYREMPHEMKTTLLAELLKDTVPLLRQNKTPQPFKHLGEQSNDRYASLSWGMFEEVNYNRPVEQYGRTLFDAQKQCIKGFVEQTPLYNGYDFDPVVFALSVDPLYVDYPWNSPYAFAENRVIDGIDLEGLEYYYTASGALIGKVGNSNVIRVVSDRVLAFSVEELKKDIGRANQGDKRAINFLFHGSKNLMDSNPMAIINVISSILKNDLGIDKKNVSNVAVELRSGSFIAYCNCDGSGSNTSKSGSPVIGINQDNSLLNDKYNLSSILLKEVSHLTDESNRKRYGITGADLLGHQAILGTSMFLNSTDAFKKSFLQSAGFLIWTYKNAMMNAKNEDERNAYKQFIDATIGIYQSHGIEFDFSIQMKTYEFMGGEAGNNGQGAIIDAETGDIGVSIKGKKL